MKMFFQRIPMIGFIIAVGALFFGTAAFAASPNVDLKKLCAELSKDVCNEVSAVPNQPHFLRGFKREADDWERSLAWRRYLSNNDLLMGSSQGKARIDRSKSGYEQPSGDTAILTKWKSVAGPVDVLYTHHHVNAQGFFMFWSSATGEANMARFSPLYAKYETLYRTNKFNLAQWNHLQTILGWTEFTAIRNFTEAMMNEGLDKAVRLQKGLPDRVIALRAERFADPKYRERLGLPDPNVPGVTVGDVIRVPWTNPENFVKPGKMLILITPSEFTGGFTNAYNVPNSESAVMLSINGLALQYLGGFTLAAHEFTHANPYLQGMPFSSYFDVEMWADMTVNMDDGFLSMLGHPYLSVIREIVQAKFGYNFSAVRKRISPVAFAVTDVREDEFRKNAKIVREIEAYLEDRILNPENGVLVQFYIDPNFWTTVNTKYCDSAAAVRIMIGLQFASAGIYDPEKGDDPVAQTQQWLAQQEQAGKIAALAKKAMAKTGKKTEVGEKFANDKANAGLDMDFCPADSRFFSGNAAEQKEFRDTVEALVGRAKSGDLVARTILRNMFPNIGPLQYLH
ncbi:MAG: hypothetical protein A2942_02885 [Candidatus Lloydbacteria bacterium RIFCSPLOWO2_01_FULL_50_20]|uniref:Uncharacterized protein n=1 Tax=Candidatus Lloydbacteria bacterium RIFCSPLOWO2_01_FULL_50_20 TaxID=1798665 RepID=A0A1G2DM02_9BACT|nr:MAG: hypothetical protein A2942_02885 [Candidatus Lloydbacteria bacterium RIFCSPLOWO2_01_FULL_50_20]